MSEHRLTTEHGMDSIGRPEHWATCTCGWQSRRCIFPSEARREGHDHEANPS